MRWNHISDSDNLFRHCIFPVSFKGKVFAWEKFLYLEQLDDGSLHASLVWERYAPSVKYLHMRGCRLAARRNEKLQEAGKSKEKYRQIYCGAYQLTGYAVRAVALEIDEVESADVIHLIEEGEIAHTDVKIVLKTGDVPSIEATKTAVVDRLWNASAGPLRHVCSCDQSSANHPNSALSTPPNGSYVDRRSSTMRFWHLIRYWLLECGWRLFGQEVIRASFRRGPGAR